MSEELKIAINHIYQDNPRIQRLATPAAEPEHVEVAPAVQDGPIEPYNYASQSLSYHSLSRRCQQLEAALTLAREALEAYPSFVEICDHGQEPDYCDGCQYAHEKAVKEWQEVRRAALAASQPGSTQ
jgi:hypothetical protein